MTSRKRPNGKAALGWQIKLDLAAEFKQEAQRQGMAPGELLAQLMEQYLNNL
jgi:hypothetical protein